MNITFPCEFLKMLDYKENGNKFSNCNDSWHSISSEEVDKMLHAVACLANLKEEEFISVAQKELDAGKAFFVAIGYIRKITNLPKCSDCGCSISDWPAISRIDNKSELCSDCGRAEAMREFERKYGSKS